VAPAATAGAHLLLAIETIFSFAMWAPLPLGWFWVGAQVYEATGSIAADLGVVLAGFLASLILVMRSLMRVDAAWISLRRRAGYNQRHGALNQVIIVCATIGLLGFFLWYYIIDQAFILPFMPTT